MPDEESEGPTIFLILRKGKEPGTLSIEAKPEVLLKILDDACENPLMHVKRSILTEREEHAVVRRLIYEQFTEIVELTELDKKKEQDNAERKTTS